MPAGKQSGYWVSKSAICTGWPAWWWGSSRLDQLRANLVLRELLAGALLAVVGLFVLGLATISWQSRGIGTLARV